MSFEKQLVFLHASFIRFLSSYVVFNKNSQCFHTIELKPNGFYTFLSNPYCFQSTSFVFTNLYIFETQYIFRKHLLFSQSFNKNPYFLNTFLKTDCFLLCLGKIYSCFYRFHTKTISFFILIFLKSIAAFAGFSQKVHVLEIV